jgi:apolipoprotein N-acyltransferase
MPDGTITSRYDKVRIVPFGEYLPLRSLLDHFVPGGLLSRDAEPGHGPAVLDLPTTKVGVVISWEVFFGGRARDGVAHGGTLILNPTNGSSYTGTVLQSQQIASSRLRAMEEGRWVVQVAPTGFSAFVTPTGHVLDRTGVSAAAVRVHTVQLRTGRTIYSRVGDLPVVALAALALAVAAFLARPRPGSELQEDGDRPVVDELDGHLGAEPAGGHGGPEGVQPRHDGVDEGFGLFRASGGDPTGPPPP